MGFTKCLQYSTGQTHPAPSCLPSTAQSTAAFIVGDLGDNDVTWLHVVQMTPPIVDTSTDQSPSL